MPRVSRISDRGGFWKFLQWSALLILDGLGILGFTRLILDGAIPLALISLVIIVGVNAICIRPGLGPIRWLTPGLTLAVLFAVYPVLFTVYISFTNYGAGHILTREQVVQQLEERRYATDTARSFSWRLYEDPSGELRLLLTDSSGTQYVAGTGFLNVYDSNELDGFERVTPRERLRRLSELEGRSFGTDQDRIEVRSSSVATQVRQRFVFDRDTGLLFDQRENVHYRADPRTGFFVDERGNQLLPGFRVPVRLDNYIRLIQSPALRGPLLTVFIWTFTFAGLSVVSTFLFGLLLAIAADGVSPILRKPIRSMLILPQAVPGVIGILVWRGLLNRHVGAVTGLIEAVFGTAPAWFSNPVAARSAVLILNLWLGYPYMMLVCSGALQSIPRELYEAARVDGASVVSVFARITLPLVLVAAGPVLISSFAMNFNNFNVIYLFNQGGPPIPGTPVPAGYTDILISYTYRLAFASGSGADYGFASAITVAIFAVLFVITLINFRFTRVWEEISENG